MSARMTIGSLRTRSISTPAWRLTSANGSVSSATSTPICHGVACSSTAAGQRQREVRDLRAERRDRRRHPELHELRVAPETAKGGPAKSLQSFDWQLHLPRSRALWGASACRRKQRRQRRLAAHRNDAPRGGNGMTRGASNPVPAVCPAGGPARRLGRQRRRSANSPAGIAQSMPRAVAAFMPSHDVLRCAMARRASAAEWNAADSIGDVRTMRMLTRDGRSGNRAATCGAARAAECGADHTPRDCATETGPPCASGSSARRRAPGEIDVPVPPGIGVEGTVLVPDEPRLHEDVLDAIGLQLPRRIHADELGHLP